MKDGGTLANVIIDGVAANPASEYKGTKVDEAMFNWAKLGRN